MRFMKALLDLLVNSLSDKIYNRKCKYRKKCKDYEKYKKCDNDVKKRCEKCKQCSKTQIIIVKYVMKYMKIASVILNV